MKSTLIAMLSLLRSAHGFVHCNARAKNSIRIQRLHTIAIEGNEEVAREPPMKLNLLDLNEKELETILKSWGHPGYRAKQVWGWVATKGARSWEDMGNVPAALRAQLDDHFTLGTLKIAVEQVSKDGTRKRAYELHDGQLVESVLMPYGDGRRTACISSQAGCGMGCSFCATGQMGFARHLSSGEIFEQASTFAAELVREKGERLSNVVFMGMGEPLANYDNVLAAMRRIQAELGIGARHITVSTVGLVPRIRQLAQEPEQFTLAVSLHEAENAARSAIMPINRRYPIEELLGACAEYVGTTGRRVTFEWALIKDTNDGPEVAHRLGSLLKEHGLVGAAKTHVNIIPLNPTGGFAGQPANPKALRAFVDVLASYGVPATARVRRGIDIDAGCGQLTQSRKKVDERAARRREMAKATAQALAEDEDAEPPEETVAGGWGFQ